MVWKRLTAHVYHTENDPETDRPCIAPKQRELLAELKAEYDAL